MCLLFINHYSYVKMKFTLGFVSTLFATASAAVEISEVSADSKFGQAILSKARQVAEGEGDQTWIANMSLKFQGCHHISQWNSDAQDAEDVRIESKRLAKFRLCPSDSCSSKAARGCSKGYGDYLVDLDDFLASYLENKQEMEQANNNYYQGQGDNFELNNYLQCAEYKPNDGRRLAYYQNNQYFIGTYCANQGGSVLLGMFTDDACTNFADGNQGRTTFYQLEGKSLPYSDSSIIDSSCYSCKDQNGDGGNNYYNAEPKQLCTDLYDIAGKCESNLYNNYNKNENACVYIKGIKTSITSSGIINSGRGGNKVASAFISIFGISFVALGSYVYYLKTKLDRGRINLTD